MKFDFYDVFSKVLPGGVLAFAIIACGFFIPSTNIPDLSYLFTSYFLGYIIDAIAAKIQIKDWLWIAFRGKPSVILLGGNKFLNQEYIQLKELKEKVGENWNENDLNKTFDYIFHKTVSAGSPRVKGFNAHWISSRNMFFAFLLSFIPVIIFVYQNELYFNYKIILLSLMMIFVAWILFDRAKSRQFYFIKEVLNSYLFSSIQKQDKGDT